jgi:arylamine N-acetyltransferase
MMVADPPIDIFLPSYRTPPLTVAQLESYLERIGLNPATILAQCPSLELLNKVVFHQSSYIPFENSRLYLLGKKVSIQVDDIHRELVLERRGGYCFQVNTLMASALIALGFEGIKTGVARSIKYQEAIKQFAIKGTTHMIVFVPLGERLYLVDVGYNGIGLSGPIEIVDGAEVETAGDERHKVTQENLTGENADGYVLYHKRASGAPDVPGADADGWLKQVCILVVLLVL